MAKESLLERRRQKDNVLSCDWITCSKYGHHRRFNSRSIKEETNLKMHSHTLCISTPILTLEMTIFCNLQIGKKTINSPIQSISIAQIWLLNWQCRLSGYILCCKNHRTHTISFEISQHEFEGFSNLRFESKISVLRIWWEFCASYFATTIRQCGRRKTLA